MRVYLLPVLLLSASSAAASLPSGCQEDYFTCKEDCSIEFGGSGRAIKQLTRCLGDCQESLDLCADRHSSLKDLPPGVVADEARPARRSEPARKKARKSREEDPFGDDAPAPRRPRGGDPYGDMPAADAKGGTDRRDSTRASESKREEVPPAPAPAPVSRPRGTSSRADAEETVLGTSADGSRRSGYRASDVEPEPEAKAGLEDLEPLDEKPTVLPAPPPTRQPTTTAPKAPPRPTLPPDPKEDISEWDPNGD